MKYCGHIKRYNKFIQTILRGKIKGKQQKVDNSTSGKIISRFGMSRSMSECSTRVRYRESWRSISANHHCEDGTWLVDWLPFNILYIVSLYHTHYFLSFIISDLNSCEDINITVSSPSTKYTIAIVGSIVTAVLLLVILLIFIFCLRRRQLRRQVSRQKALTDEEMEELQQKILKACDKDAVSCKKGTVLWLLLLLF